MTRYFVSAMVVYSEEIEAENAQEAFEKFESNCPYDIDGELFCEELEEPFEESEDNDADN